MRINGLSNVGNVYKAKKSNNMYGSQTTSNMRDEVSFSNIAKDLAVAKKEVDATSDVRMEKVIDIKTQIQAGQYNISASQVAGKLLTQSREL